MASRRARVSAQRAPPADSARAWVAARAATSRPVPRFRACSPVRRRPAGHKPWDTDVPTVTKQNAERFLVRVFGRSQAALPRLDDFLRSRMKTSRVYAGFADASETPRARGASF